MGPSGDTPNNDKTPQPESPVSSTPTTVDNPTNINEEPTPQQPANTVFSTTEPAMATLPVKKSRKGLIIGLVAGGLVLLLGGTAAGVAIWWTSPQTALDNAISKSLDVADYGSFKGETTFEGTQDMKFEFDMKYADKVAYGDLAVDVKSGMVNVNLTGSFAGDSGKNMYFKVNDVEKIVSTFAQGQQLPQSMQSLVEKVDGQWIKITEQDLEDISKQGGSLSSDKTTACVTDVMEKFSTDESFVKDISKAYGQNKFMTIKKVVGSEKINGKDSHHLEIDLDKDKAKEFGDDVKDTELFKELAKCGSSSSSSSSSYSSSDDIPTIELWVDKWSHKINKISMKLEENKQTMTMSFTLGYDKPEIDMPTKSVDFSELKSDYEKIIKEQQSYYDYSDSYTPTTLEDYTY